MEKGNPAEAPAARDPNGKGRATTASQAETTEPRVPSRAGDSVGGPLDWEEIKATSRRILRRSPNRNRCWKWMKRRAEEMMRTNLARIPTDLAGSGKAGGYNDNKLETYLFAYMETLQQVDSMNVFDEEQMLSFSASSNNSTCALSIYKETRL
ncbi:uncharacterized protein [Aegilops tauschii subsp. strangulata]|uniref:uncharacterized protein n=2 Tax=Triticinae TaxID=1648030 RepID=UPI001ABD2ED6|nr:uncharacterized protein LOC109735411 [Aegilops tauschii subsp. strangulata]